MYKQFEAAVHKEAKDGTYLYALLPKESLAGEIGKFSKNGILTGELRIDDGRTISSKQRKKAWATLGDISLWNGDDREINHWWLKIMFMTKNNVQPFSLSDCSMTTARHYISFLLDFCLEQGLPLSEPILNRTDDIDATLYASLKHRRCIICGRNGEIHHRDAIGMGNNRKKIDDSQHRKICLCRTHHTEAHKIGNKAFENKYHVYGIVFNELEVVVE